MQHIFVRGPAWGSLPSERVTVVRELQTADAAQTCFRMPGHASMLPNLCSQRATSKSPDNTVPLYTYSRTLQVSSAVHVPSGRTLLLC